MEKLDFKKLLTITLGFGVFYAWTNVYISFRRFYSFEGEIFKFKDCVLTNPILTPCFWGASAFLIAFLWSLFNLKIKDNKKLLKSHKRLTFLVTFGTVFAWSVFGYELISFYLSETKSIQTCAGTIYTPLKSSCLYGAIIYTIGLFFGIKSGKIIETA